MGKLRNEAGNLDENVLSSDLLDVWVKVKRAYAAADYLCQDYFGYSEEYYKKNTGELLAFYERAADFAGILIEYLHDAKALMENIQAVINNEVMGNDDK